MDGYGWGMGLGWLWMVAFWVFIVSGAVWVALSVRGDGGRDGARRILDERLARGEIDVEEHRARLAALGTR
ncbi:MAG TPA: SHOCT domain-containing protein [Candidatus Limnocylindria bacterium]|nr:SHOCT domain-containing protein [Candidatus Limnocylindria bacterium]